MLIDKGHILISTPNIIGDLYFHRSTIIIVDKADQNFIGFIFNKKLDYSLNELIDKIRTPFPIYYGGPIESDSLFYLYKSKINITGSKLVSKNLFWSGNFNEIIELINKNLILLDDIKFFMGYSGWSLNQLNSEIKDKSWETINFSSENEILTDKIKDVWKNHLYLFGEKYLLWTNTPENPNNN